MAEPARRESKPAVFGLMCRSLLLPLLVLTLHVAPCKVAAFASPGFCLSNLNPHLPHAQQALFRCVSKSTAFASEKRFPLQTAQGQMTRSACCLQSCWPRRRCKNSSLLTRASGTDKAAVNPLDIEIVPLVDPNYARTLAIICCRSFYGEHRPIDSVNIFASLQRALLFEEIVGDLSRRLVRYQSMGSGSALGCGRVLTAVEAETGTLVGFLDLSLTLYDTVKQEFLVSEGPGLAIPRPGLERRAYIANLAVSQDARRRGVAEQLLQQAEDVAKKWADCDNIWLEVSKSNVAAVNLYRKLGYAVQLEEEGSKEVVRGAFGYSMQISPRLRFKKELERAEGETAKADF